ncbi:hypothetical protein [Marinomonas sp. THO17]|uniref:hypothetical protein n=1 Tax=Marinomonas sp. THO17 TaxID=3149048 RepID=UPI00336C03E5
MFISTKQQSTTKHPRCLKNRLINFILTAILVSFSSLTNATTLTVEQIIDASSIFKFDENHSMFTSTAAPDELSTTNGNTESTLGAQRLKAFKYALGIIASELRINQTIDIVFYDSDTNCDYYATASYAYSYQNGKNQIANTLYPSSLANQLLQTDTSNNSADIWIRINPKYLNGSCNKKFNYGLYSNEKNVNAIDFVQLIMHEMTHGMGFEKRPSNDSNPFIYERMLWVKDKQDYYSNLNNDQRTEAQKVVSNIVFNGRITRQQASNILDTSVKLVPQTTQESNIPKIDSNVVTTGALPESGIVGQINIVNFDTCAISGNLGGKIVLLPDGCARKEFGYDGTQYDTIIKAQNQGASAIITSAAETFRVSAFTDITIPVVTMPLSDYKNLQSAIELLPSDTTYSLEKQANKLMGTDESGRPFVHTGLNLGSASILLHWKPSVSPKPVNNRTVRNIMEPNTVNGLEYAQRSIRSTIPALIDMGWAVHSCGNGVVEEFEECDSGNINGTASCAQNCTLPGYCGDGVVNSATEECDDGKNNNDNTVNACSSMCTVNK